MIKLTKWLMSAFAMVTVMVIVCVVYKLYQVKSEFHRVASLLPAELKAAKAEGLPLGPSDLRPNPPIPASQNAAPIYVRIHQMIADRPKSDKDSIYEFFTNKNQDHEAVRKALSRNAAVFKLAEQATSLPHCDFNRKYELGFDLLLPEYASLRELARELMAKVVIESEDGHMEQAFDTIQEGFRLAGHLREDPPLIAMLVSLAIEAIMDSAFRDVVLAHQNDPAMLALAGKCLQSAGPLPDLEFHFRSELVICHVTVDMIRNHPDKVSIPYKHPDWSIGEHVGPDVTDAWEYRSVSYWRAVYAALRAHRGDLLGTTNALKVLGDQAELHEHQPTYELEGFTLPVFSQAASKIQKAQALRHLRSTLLQLVAYRQQQGKFPIALADLKPAPPIDPFSGKPLLYRRKGNGFILYSVGEDLADDGGSVVPKTKDGPKPDIVIDGGE